MYLNLCSVSRCDVGDGPARLLPDGFLGTTEQVQEAGESGAVQHHLGQRKREDEVTIHLLKPEIIIHEEHTHLLTQTHLRLNVISCNNVSNGPQSRRCHLVIGVPARKEKERGHLTTFLNFLES